jgi:hypothetical protein
MSARHIIIILIATAFLPSSSRSQTNTNSNPSVQNVAAGYTNYQRITEDPVYVNPELAASCVGATKKTVEAARVKFGPHANATVLIYMNKLGADAFNSNATDFPVGSAIVKQKFIFGYLGKTEKDSEPAHNGVGGMVKRPAGYDPEHGDWEYFYFDDPAKIESGRIESCVQCHSAAKSKDYVFGTWRKSGTLTQPKLSASDTQGH